MAGSDGDVDEPREARALVEPAEAQKETPDGTSAIDRSRAAVWLERFLYVELVLGFALFVIEVKVINCSAIECDIKNGEDKIGGLFAQVVIGLAVTGLVTYFARLSCTNLRRWFHLPFVLLLVAAALSLLFLYLHAMGIGLSDSSYCS